MIVEFCPDEPEVSEPESPLDDLRQQLIETEAKQN
ncbi:MAG: KGK domain-containing protein [Cyanobacteria bacterium J06592_8]